MAKRRMDLTTARVKALKYSGGASRKDIVWDSANGSPSGFGVRCYDDAKAGSLDSKSFVFQYRKRTQPSGPEAKTKAIRGAVRLTVIGRCKDLSLGDARAEANRISVAVRQEGEPAKPTDIPLDVTLAAYAPVFLEEMHKRGKRTVSEMNRRLYKHIVPALGDLSLRKIKRADIHRMHGSIKAPVEANRVVGLTSTLFLWAERMGYVPENHPNPCRGVEKYPEKSRTRFLTDEELERLTSSMKEEPRQIQALIWLYLLTGARKSELLGLRWEDVHLDSAEPFFYLGNTKSGRDMHVQLSEPAVRLFNQIERHAHSPFCFPSPVRTMRSLQDFRRYWRRIRERACMEDVRLHDLRRTCGTKLAEAGVPLHTIAKVLNHSDVATTEIYARISDNVQKKALDALAENLEDTLGEVDLFKIQVVS